MSIFTAAPESAAAKAAVLAEALPYIREFSGKTVVVKYGGNAMTGEVGTDDDMIDLFAQDVVLMRLVGMNPVVVHGGGPQISDLMRRLGKEPVFVDGLRVTDAETIDIVRMALVGKVNREVVAAVNRHGPYAVGLSGEDAGLITVKQRDPKLGFVGDVTRINTSVLERQLHEELVPVVASVGVDESGQAYNVNADAVAGAIAEALGAEKLVYLTNVAGLYRDFSDPTSLISQIGAIELSQMLEQGLLAEGMVPKIRSCVAALANGVGRAHLLDGRIPHALLLECFTREGVGTMVVPETAEDVMSTFDEIAATDAGHVMQTYARLPVAFVRGEGTRLWDSEGREYLDFLSGLAVVSLGHAHPEVAEAIAEQARTLLHVSNLYYNDVQPKVAAKLDHLLGDGGQVFFSNSGAEANECAIKLARRLGQRNNAERYHVISALNSFHGRTLSALAATGQPAKQATFQPLPTGFSQVPFGDLDALAAAVKEVGDGLAAVLLEAVQGEGGVHVAPDGYLPAVRELCDRAGAILMFDEVQTGLGRTGRWFGFEHFDVAPDVVTMAKALGNGVPIGACWARLGVAKAFDAGDHATTFGGQPLAARAALAVLEVMERERVPERAAKSGARLGEGLAATPGVASVRGLGLLLAAELDGVDAKAAAGACLERGLVVNAVTPTALRFAPPLLVTEAEIDDALGRVKDALAACS